MTPPDPSRLVREVRKLHLAAGDLVVCTVDEQLDRAELELLRFQLDAVLPDDVQAIVTPYRIDKVEVDEDSIGAFDADELVLWAQRYGHPESWVKRAQAAHARAERAQAQLAALLQTRGQFTDLGVVGPVGFQGGIIGLQGNGCPGCGNGFWTEADRDRRLGTGAIHHCPHCGQRREVTS